MLSWLWNLLGKKARPGEIWWADVPYEDGTGSKIRPCVILMVRLRGYHILKITSQDQSHRRDHVQIPTKMWDRHAAKDSFLDLSDPIRITTVDDKAGALDRATWRKVKQLHGI